MIIKDLYIDHANLRLLRRCQSKRDESYFYWEAWLAGIQAPVTLTDEDGAFVMKALSVHEAIAGGATTEGGYVS